EDADPLDLPPKSGDNDDDDRFSSGIIGLPAPRQTRRRPAGADRVLEPGCRVHGNVELADLGAVDGRGRSHPLAQLNER
ncbi:hypothetical protein THAOC_36047, partial [Thalassiosira oceanica]